MPLSLSVNYRSLERAARGLGAAVGHLVNDRTLILAGTEVILRYVREEAPVKTGRLRDSITARGSGLKRGIYGLFYGRYVVEGTKPHTIRPTHGRVLRFEVAGGVVYATSVQHPGTKPNPFPQRAVKKAEPALRVLMLQNGRRLVSTIRSGG